MVPLRAGLSAAARGNKNKEGNLRSSRLKGHGGSRSGSIVESKQLEKGEEEWGMGVGASLPENVGFWSLVCFYAGC